MGLGCRFALMAGLGAVFLVGIIAGFLGTRIANFDAIGFGESAGSIIILFVVVPAFLIGYRYSKKKAGHNKAQKNKE